MAHFVKLDENNIVVDVQVISDNDCMVNGVESDSKGQEFLNNTLNMPGTWIRTSYNTRGNKHYNPETNELSADQSKAFRGNYAGIGMKYDSTRNVFIHDVPFASWIFDEENCRYKAPTPYPSVTEYTADGQTYLYSIYWKESTISWIGIDHLLNEHTWNPDTSSWS